MPDEPLLDQHLAHCRARNLRPATLQARRNIILRVGRALGQPVATASGEALAAWQQTRTASPRTMTAEAAHIIGYLRWAHEHGHRTDLPATSLVRPRIPRAIPRPISEADLKLAIREAPPRIRPWLILGAYCGLRAGEVAQLERGHLLDADDPPALLIVGKGGHERIVPIGDHVLAELRSHGLPTRGPLFPRADGKPGPNASYRISAAASSYLRSVGLSVSFHALRHRFATQVYRDTHDLHLTGQLLGHVNVRTTAGYAAYSRTAAVEAVRALDERLPNL